MLDVVVIGGGPAAVSAALELEKKEVDYVMIYPKNSIKVCGGLLTPETIKWLMDRNLEKCINNSLVKPQKTDLFLVDLIKKEKNTRKKYITNIDRQKFDEELLNNIDDDRKIDGFVNKIKEFNGIYRIEYNGSFIETKHIIYTVGPRSIFLKKTPRLLIQNYYEINGKNLNNVLFVLHKKINGFYLWIVPKGNYLMVGSLGESRKFFNLIVEETFKFLEYEIFIKKIIKRESGLMIFPEKNEDILLYNNKILFAGESAGLISRKTGKGIYYALVSGELAGKYYDSAQLYSKAVKPLIEKVNHKISEANQMYYYS